MNDVLATLLALGLLYLVVKFAFGGPSTSSANHREPIPAHEQGSVAAQNRAAAAATSSSWTSGGSSKRETLISRYGLEGRLDSASGADAGKLPSNSSVVERQGTVHSKGKSKMQTDEDWKKGAEGRREELKRRKEEMILEARRKLLEKQQPRASVMESTATAT